MAFLNETGLARMLNDLKTVFARTKHGNHVPAVGSPNNAIFLRNDNTWQYVTPEHIGAATTDHTHDDRYYTQSEIDEKIHGDVKSVNGVMPDLMGNVLLATVPFADNLTSEQTQDSEGIFIIRTAGGDASISDGDAFVTRIEGNNVHTGEVAEELNMTVIPVQRVAPDPITAELDAETFTAYVEEAGSYVMTYSGTEWDHDLELYGVTVTGTPFTGDNITIVWDGESEPEMTVIAPRYAPEAITATIDRDTFVGYVSVSGTTTLTYTSDWSADPALYGVTVSNEPVSGDQIVIVYVKEDRGTIVVATPTAFKSTGWNLYNHTAGYAYLTKYSQVYGFYIGGNYTALQYSATIDGEKTTITPASNVFTIPADGYVWVSGGDGTTTYIVNQWSDWTDGHQGDFEAYSETTISIASEMSSYFPYGLMSVGAVRDEININAGQAISKIERIAYTAANLAMAKASGRSYECDTNYIYIVKELYDHYSIAIDGSYMASDHGNEFFVGTTVPVYLETMYGNNLKNKLERDVVTVSQQTLSDNQKTQVRSNINAASKDEVKPITITLNPVTNANGSYSNTTSNSLVSEDMKAVSIDVGTPETFLAPITITTGNGTVSLSCPNAKGSSTVQVTMIRTQPVDVGTSYPSVTSTEFDILAGRIGSLSSLTTSNKTSLVAATNELNSNITTYNIGSNTLANLETALATFGSSLSNKEIRPIVMSPSATSGLFSATSYYGTIRRDGNGRYNVTLQGMQSPEQVVYGNYINGAWTWSSAFSFGERIDITNSVSITNATLSYAQKAEVNKIVSIVAVFTVTNPSGFSLRGLPNPYTNAHIALAYNSTQGTAIPIMINAAGEMTFVSTSGVSANDSLRVITTYMR